MVCDSRKLHTFFLPPAAFREEQKQDLPGFQHSWQYANGYECCHSSCQSVCILTVKLRTLRPPLLHPPCHKTCEIGTQTQNEQL
eukprot:71554-Amphidinium_carterae.1